MKLYVFTYMDPDREVGAVTDFTRKGIEERRRKMVRQYPWVSFAKIEALPMTLSPPERPQFATGDKVCHDVFGNGVVVGYKPKTIGGGAVRIEFTHPVGTKELELAFAMHKLRKGHNKMRTVREMIGR